MSSIIVIGASSGLGRRVAEIFASRGWRVGIAARRLELLQQIAAAHPGMEVEAVDVCADDVAARLDALSARLGGADVVFNAAGCGWLNPGLDIDNDLHTARVDVVGFTAVADWAFNHFRSAGRPGHFAAITSVAGVKGLGISASYSASKRYEWEYILALSQLSNNLGLGITFTDIRPGFVDTPLLNTSANRYPMLMSVDHVAPLIVRAIERRKRVAVIDWRWRILTALWKRIPNLVWRHFPLTRFLKN